MEVVLKFLAILSGAVIALNSVIWLAVALVIYRRPSLISDLRFTWHDGAALVATAYLIAYWSIQ